MKKTIFLILIFCFKIFGDGAMIPPTNYNYEINGRGQIALIKHYGNIEELSILAKLFYVSQGFAWVVPLPSTPEIDEVNTGIFSELAEISKPVYRYRSYDFDCSSPGISYDRGEGKGDDYFLIVENAKNFDLLSTVVIYTNHVDSLKNWLENNGYSVSDQVISYIQSYIDKNWNHFFCAKVLSGESDRNSVGVKLTFATEEPVYPMKISRANYYSSSSLLFLYVISAHKMTFSKSDLLYANRINEDELKKIKEDFPESGAYLNQDDYLTKLYKEYTSSGEMEDITLTQAVDDKEYRELYGRYYYNYYGMNVPLFPFGLFLYLFINYLYYFFKKRKKLKV
jgi:hypothetical protein